MLDNKGSLYVMDAVLAIVLLLVVFLIINSAISIPTHEYSYESKNIRTAQDVMELLSGRIDFQDESFLSKISTILSDDENSKESIREVSQLCEDKLDSYDFENYRFSENNILKGNITYSDILTVLPFSNKVVVMKVIGQDILDSLEYAMKYLPKRSGKFVQVSGIKFKVYENIKSPVIIDEYDTFVKIEGERRVFDVFIGNEKINENKTYTVALNSFMAEGGDGFTMFTKYNVTNDTDGFISNVCKEYIQNELNKTIPDMYNTSLGRIIKVKKNNSGYLIKYFGGKKW